MVLSYIQRALTSTQVTILSGYFRRLLSPPLPGDGLLIVGFVEGLVGWSLSWMLVSGRVQPPFRLLFRSVLLWLGRTPGILAVGGASPAPSAPPPRLLLVPARLHTSAAAINVATVAGYFPGPLADVDIVREFLGFGYWRPWFLALGLGYLATAAYNWENPQIRKGERVVYALTGVVCLVILSPWPGIPVVGQQVVFGESLFVVGALLHLVPMGFDVLSDVVLILRQSW